MSKKTGNFDFNDSVSLKEYFEEKFCALDRALELQAGEYSRRLEGLNHEARQLKDMQSTYVPRETYDNYVKTMQETVRNLELSRAELSGKASQKSLNFTMIASIIGLLISLITLVFRLI